MLNFANRVLLLGRPDPSSVDPDVARFFAAVASNSGTLGATSQAAFGTLVAGLKSAGIWSSLQLLAPLLGDQLAGAMVAYNPAAAAAVTMSNINLVSGDYSLVSGLQGDGVSKYVDTGCEILGLSQTSFFAGVWVLGDSTGGSNITFGSSYNYASATQFFVRTAGTGGGSLGLGSGSGNIPTGLGWRSISYTGALFAGYLGSTQEFSISESVGAWQQAGTVVLLSGAGDTVYHSNARVGFFVVAGALTSAQNAALASLIGQFLAAIGRS